MKAQMSLLMTVTVCAPQRSRFPTFISKKTYDRHPSLNNYYWSVSHSFKSKPRSMKKASNSGSNLIARVLFFPQRNHYELERSASALWITSTLLTFKTCALRGWEFQTSIIIAAFPRAFSSDTGPWLLRKHGCKESYWYSQWHWY